MPGYDPRQMQQIQQMGRMGVGMMGPQPGPYDRNSPQRPPQWWERPMPQAQQQPADAPSARAACRPAADRPQNLWRGVVRALVLGVVLLAASVAAQAEDRRKCVRDLIDLHGDRMAAKRQCDPKNFVTNPNEYGWVCSGNGPAREKGMGLKQKKDVVCE